MPMPDGDVVSMTDAELQGLAASDPRLAAYAASHLPAWLWTADGKRILWANPAGARVFGATDSTALAEKTFGPADRHRRQIARLAGRLIAPAAPSGWSACRDLAQRPACWRPAARCGSTLPMAATAF